MKIFCLRNPGTNKSLQQGLGYKVNVKKLVVPLYTINEQMKFEIKNAMPFILDSLPKMKYLGIN